jgi:hypothetical protein
MANANRYGFQFRTSPTPAVWDLFAKVTIGANGAPTLVAAKSLGFTSISRVSAGKYLITFQSKYPRLLMVLGTFIASGGAAAPNVVVDTDAIASAGTITILTQAGGVNTDPASGEILHLDVVVKNSTIAVG